MKVISFFLLMIACFAGTEKLHAQAWQRNSTVLAIGLGTSRFYHLDDDLFYDHPRNRRWYGHTTGQFNFQGEFGIHNYVGLGFTTGVGGRFSRGGRGISNHYKREVNFPFGLIANFHFYQLIADRRGKNLHADKLDIYAGANFGSGIAITYFDDIDRRIYALAFGGLHAGVRYYFAENVGANFEFGWGKNLVNIGFVFKM